MTAFPDARATHRARIDVARLVSSQALYYGGVSVDLTLTSLAGLRLAPTPLLATLPLTLIMASGLVAAVGTGLLASSWGYRRTMAVGALFAVVGGLVAAIAVLQQSFWMLCLGTALIGVYRATGGYIRYLAADLAAPGRAERALATVMYGGLIAAFAGPFAALAASGLFPTEFVGSYLMSAALGIVAVPLALTISREPVRTDAVASARAVTVRQARGNPNFAAALVVLPVSAALMTLVMAVGPLASMDAHHSAETGAAMIQWHLVGMFAPAIFSGELLRRWGPRTTTLVGAATTALGAVTGAASTDAVFMIAALILAGVGWNLLFLSGSAYLLRCYASGTGARLQAVAEGVTGLASVVASLVSAAVFSMLGWQLSNAPVLAISVGLGLWIALHHRQHASGVREYAADVGQES